mmetsp:Transcript_11704/g.43610  ORF Transcript_11704/g.43610 Transcript_11704/m.43610 type:complete len:397 (-) Transcript_11704:155-1345(-)
MPKLSFQHPAALTAPGSAHSTKHHRRCRLQLLGFGHQVGHVHLRRLLFAAHVLYALPEDALQPVKVRLRRLKVLHQLVRGRIPLADLLDCVLEGFLHRLDALLAPVQLDLQLVALLDQPCLPTPALLEPLLGELQGCQVLLSQQQLVRKALLLRQRLRQRLAQGLVLHRHGLGFLSDVRDPLPSGLEGRAVLVDQVNVALGDGRVVFLHLLERVLMVLRERSNMLVLPLRELVHVKLRPEQSLLLPLLKSLVQAAAQVSDALVKELLLSALVQLVKLLVNPADFHLLVRLQCGILGAEAADPLQQRLPALRVALRLALQVRVQLVFQYRQQHFVLVLEMADFVLVHLFLHAVAPLRLLLPQVGALQPLVHLLDLRPHLLQHRARRVALVLRAIPPR